MIQPLSYEARTTLLSLTVFAFCVYLYIFSIPVFSCFRILCSSLGRFLSSRRRDSRSSCQRNGKNFFPESGTLYFPLSLSDCLRRSYTKLDQLHTINGLSSAEFKKVICVSVTQVAFPY